jgi:4-hydroxy-3-methylbut-2-enyl diphosphate reductase
MKVIRADVLGFCFGVKRAVAAAENALGNTSSHRTFTLGPLIHNPSVLADLKKKGLAVLDENDLEAVQKNDVVIIRAHGTTPTVIEQLALCGATILDETCPRVLASQKLAAKWAREGYCIIIAGDKNHGEVTGISGYASNAWNSAVHQTSNCCDNGERVVVVQNKEEAEAMKLPEKAVLLAQTTFSPESFDEISALLLKKNKQLLVFNTICTATMERQNALKKLAGVTDGIIVIGGKNSANTRRLYETAQTICTNAALIEHASQIPELFFSLSTVALTAGASTPDEVIDSVEQTLLHAANEHK